MVKRELSLKAIYQSIYVPTLTCGHELIREVVYTHRLTSKYLVNYVMTKSHTDTPQATFIVKKPYVTYHI